MILHVLLSQRNCDNRHSLCGLSVCLCGLSVCVVCLSVCVVMGFYWLSDCFQTSSYKTLLQLTLNTGVYETREADRRLKIALFSNYFQLRIADCKPVLHRVKKTNKVG